MDSVFYVRLSKFKQRFEELDALTRYYESSIKSNSIRDEEIRGKSLDCFSEFGNLIYSEYANLEHQISSAIISHIGGDESQLNPEHDTNLNS